MNKLSPRGTLISAAAWLGCCVAREPPPECPRALVVQHVREQAARYSPLSVQREFFGFIYLRDGVVRSALAEGRSCPNPSSCGLNTRAAAKQVPRGVKILGEWHTHPKGGSSQLSREDVRGAYDNRRIRCYVPFYVTNGKVYAWDATRNTVNGAMVSRRRVDDLAERLVE